MSQLTLRNLPEPLEREIRMDARRRGSSLNKAIIGTGARLLSLDMHFQHIPAIICVPLDLE